MSKEKKQSVFDILNQINVNEHTERKGNLTYLSWSFAWQVVKANFPASNYNVYENDLGFNYHTDGHTAWVKVGVTIEDQEHIEYLPVMDFKNKSIPKDQVTSFHVNTAIQRALTKAIARHGLGLYIYAGEDLPSENPTSRKTYNTWSKANDQEKLTTKKEFMDKCIDLGISKDDIQDFLDFVNPGMAENEKFNEIVHFLRQVELLEDQMESYKGWKVKNES